MPSEFNTAVILAYVPNHVFYESNFVCRTHPDTNKKRGLFIV